MKRMGNLVRKVVGRIGLDNLIGYAMLGRLWSVFSGFAVVYLVTSRLDSAEQGYYYTFQNVVGLQIFFELGLGYVVMQAASHEMAKLHIMSDGVINGDSFAKARMSCLFKKGTRIYLLVSLIFLFVVGIIGGGFLARGNVDGWEKPWVLLVVVSSFSLLVNALTAFFEGAGSVKQVAAVRFWQGLVGGVIVIMIGLFGGGLYIVLGVPLAVVIVGGAWLLFSRLKAMLSLWTENTSGELVWAREIWPFQWRIGLSWACSYFTIQVFTPILFHYSGPVIAGQFGTSMQIVNAIVSLSFAWIITKAPYFGGHVARKEWRELDSIFLKAFLQSLGVLLFASIGILLIITWFVFSQNSFSSRIVTIWVFAALILAGIFQHVIFSIAVYLRSHKKEPLLGINILSAILVLFSLPIMVPDYGITGVVMVMLCVQGAVVMPLCVFIFFRLRKKWHS